MATKTEATQPQISNWVKAITDLAVRPERQRRGGRSSVKEAFMLNRATVIGFAVVLAAALLLAVLVSPAFGPRPSRADLASPSMSIETLHGQVDHGKLPIHPIPEP
jgi:hypothetical protein